MTLQEFREVVHQELGSKLEEATPEKVRLFLDKMQAILYPPVKIDDHIVIEDEEAPLDYEQFVLDFFANTLDNPPDQAAVALWVFAFELWFASMEEETSRRFFRLLGQDTEEELQ